MLKAFQDNLIKLVGADPAQFRYLLAVSGGKDSIVLADLFYCSGIPFAIAHMNFQLRGAESAGDERFVRAFAQRCEVPFYGSSVDTKAFAKAERLSTQMAARTLRYRWLEDLRLQEGFDFIVTAHHLNDNVETVIYNLTKGSGIKGMLGIPAINAAVIRPLLFATQDLIDAYYKAEDLAHREDSSNALSGYARNWIRHEVVPKLKHLNPSFEYTLQRNLTYWRQIYAWFEAEAQYLSQQTWIITPLRTRIELQPLRAHPALLSLLFHWLQPFGMVADQIAGIHEAYLQERQGKLFFSQTHRVLLHQGALILEAQDTVPLAPLEWHQPESSLSLHGQKLTFSTPASRPAQLPDQHTVAWVDAAAIQFPLTLRHWQPGDLFYPLGMAGKPKKIQDYFTDEKIDRFAKERIWLLVNGDGRIIWVLGFRVDDRFKISADSTQFGTFELDQELRYW